MGARSRPAPAAGVPPPRPAPEGMATVARHSPGQQMNPDQVTSQRSRPKDSRRRRRSFSHRPAPRMWRPPCWWRSRPARSTPRRPAGPRPTSRRRRCRPAARDLDPADNGFRRRVDAKTALPARSPTKTPAVFAAIPPIESDTTGSSTLSVAFDVGSIRTTARFEVTQTASAIVAEPNAMPGTAPGSDALRSSPRSPSALRRRSARAGFDHAARRDHHRPEDHQPHEGKRHESDASGRPERAETRPDERRNLDAGSPGSRGEDVFQYLDRRPHWGLRFHPGVDPASGVARVGSCRPLDR